MMILPERSSVDFESLLEDSSVTEHRCREYLLDRRVVQLLSYYTPEKIVHISEETTGFFGRSDFCLTVEYRDGRRLMRETYVWELKSPKCPLFVRDGNQRYRPSPDLSSAENQLLHYVEEAKCNEMFWRVFDTHRDHIHFGGIIIGRSSTFADPTASYPLGSALAEAAYAVRQKYFYKQNQMRILVWDWVLDNLKDYNSETGLVSRRSGMQLAG